MNQTKDSKLTEVVIDIRPERKSVEDYLRRDGTLLRLIPDHMKTPALCLEAVKQNGKAI